MTAIDNPLNGYQGDEYLGLFLLSPGMVKGRNRIPIPRQLYWKILVENRFDDFDTAEDIYDMNKSI